MKRLLTYGFTLCLLIAITACGFHLRGAQKATYQVKTFAIQPDNPTEFFQRIFRRYLRDVGVKVVPATADEYVIRLQPEHYVREVLVIGTDAQAKQESMMYTIHFEILSPYEGSLGPQSVQVTRMLNLDPSQILGQNQEETVMLAEMREEASIQIYYRLNVIVERERRERAGEIPPESSEAKSEEAQYSKAMKEEEVTQETANPNTLDEMELVE